MKLKKAILGVVVKSAWKVATVVWPFHNRFSSFVFQNLSEFAIRLDAKHNLNTWPAEEE
jgi:hypothetical protein